MKKMTENALRLLKTHVEHKNHKGVLKLLRMIVREIQRENDDRPEVEREVFWKCVKRLKTMRQGLP